MSDADIDPDKTRGRWLDWLERIRSETFSLFLYRDLWNELGEMTKNAALPPSVIFDAFSTWYAASQALAIRRQLDLRSDSISLRRLLTEMAKRPELLSRDHYLSFFEADDHWQDYGNSGFNRLAGNGEDYVPVSVIEADLQRLQEVSQLVKRYADKMVAHADEKGLSTLPTLGEMNAAIDVIGELMNKYRTLLTAEAFATLVPVIQEDWKAPFRKPWLV
jgi:hypothetical protein